MDGFELNKMAAAGLLALLIGMVASIIADELVSPKLLEKNVYIVEGIADGVPAVVEAVAKVVIEAVEPLLASASLEKGKQVAKKCVQCHTFEKDGPNRVGPNLWNIVGAKVGQVSGYAYSRAMSEIGGNWDFDRLNRYLHKPRALVKGTKMAFAGLLKVKDRADVIAYMNSMNDSPLPLPADKASQELKQGEEQ